MPLQTETQVNAVEFKYLKNGQNVAFPAISQVDTPKKALVDEFTNEQYDWQPDDCLT